MIISVSTCTGLIRPVSRHIAALAASTTGTKTPTSSTKPSHSRPASVKLCSRTSR